jgi:hypothetical protein
MLSVANEFKRSIHEQGLSARVLPSDEQVQVRRSVLQHYSLCASAWPLWEYHRFDARVQDPDAWRKFSDFVGNTQCLIFLNQNNGWDIFEIDSGHNLVALLDDTFWFEFYVCDRQLSYVACFNHHDILLADGAAARWLRSTYSEAT